MDSPLLWWGKIKRYVNSIALGQGAVPIPGPPGPPGPPGADAIANINARGVWDAALVYMINDLVMCLDGNCYISIMDNNIGIYPPNYTNAWTKFVAKGADGPQGLPGEVTTQQLADGLAGKLDITQFLNVLTENNPWNVFNQPFSNATFDGEVNAIDVKLTANVTIVSFWGYANQNADGTPGQDFMILDPVSYPLLERFVGEVDQFAIGYNSASNDFKYVPIRVTSTGMFIVTAPNISVGTRFSYQFILILAEDSAS